jgi:hypothetical protein
MPSSKKALSALEEGGEGWVRWGGCVLTRAHAVAAMRTTMKIESPANAPLTPTLSPHQWGERE